MYKTRGEKIAERLCWILLQLYTGNTVSVNDICQRFAVSRRTGQRDLGNDSNLLIVFYVQIMPDDFVMQLHRF